MSQALAAQNPREQTILEWYPLVRTIAFRLAKRCPASVDVEELVNVGVLGLIDAVDRFDKSRGVPFKAYAEIRIRGAMVDSLRESDWTPRSVRRKVIRLEQTRRDAQQNLGREPSRVEMSDALGMAPKEYDALRQEAHIRRVVSLHAPVTNDASVTFEERISNDDPSIEELWANEELKAQVVDALRFLHKKERVVLTLSYLHGLTLREIGEILGVTESRACQLRSQGVRRLKQKLDRAV
jgi:RNA polymerase sigma factor for flagellar operon FliA